MHEHISYTLAIWLGKHILIEYNMLAILLVGVHEAITVKVATYYSD